MTRMALMLSLAGTIASTSAQAGPKIWFASPTDTTRIFYTRGPSFLIVVDTTSPDPDRVDTLEVLATTVQGDHEVIKVIETSPASGTFVAKVDVMGTHGYFYPYDGLIEVDGDAMTSDTVNLEVTLDRGQAADTAILALGFMEGAAIRNRNRFGGDGVLKPAEYSIDGRRVYLSKRWIRPGSVPFR